MNITFDLPRYCQYLLALETERALREFAVEPRAPPPAITFLQPADPDVELSIVMPVWNPSEPHLQRALRSLQAQNFGDIRYEIVVSDDASSTDTARRGFESAALRQARYHRHEANLGGMGNFNWCLSAARGRWIHMLHQDDWVEPAFYRGLLRGAAAESETDLRFCRVRLREEPGGQTRLMYDEAPTPGRLEEFLDRQTVSQRVQFAGAIFSRRAVETLGGFDPEIGPAGDWEFWARLGSRFGVYYHPGQLATYVLHPTSWTNTGAGGFADARAFQKYRLALRCMLGHVRSEKRRATAQGFLQNMLLRVIDIANRNRKSGVPDATRPMGEALFVACREAGLLRDVEKILFGIA